MTRRSRRHRGSLGRAGGARRGARAVFPVILVILFLAVSPLFARTWKGDELLRQFSLASWKLGPFHIRPAIVLNDFGYDSNIYSTNDPVKDYAFTVGPAVTVYAAIKKTIVFTVSESPRYVYYLETKRERTWNNYFRGDIHFLFNRFYISAGVSLTDTRDRWNYEIDIRPRHKEQGVQGNVLWQPSKKTSFSLGYRRTKFDYENLEFVGFHIGDQLNRDETFVNAGAYYQLSFRMRAFVDLEYGRFDFQNPLNPRDSESGAIYSGFEFSTIGKIRGRIRLGYKYLHALKAGMPDYRGLVGDSAISISLLKNLTLRGSYGRNVQFSVWADTNQYIENSTGTGVSFYVFRHKVRLDYDFTFNDNFYPPPKTAGPAGSGERRDRMWVNSAGVYFRLKKNIGLGLTIGQWHRESDIFRWKANRNFLGLNLTYDF